MSMQCVETLITVRVFPDGKYHMKFRTEGDKEDIFNQDFPIPMANPWVAEIIEKGKEVGGLARSFNYDKDYIEKFHY